MIYVIVGPTSSGKSSLGLKLAKKYNGIIVNGDAFQVYEEMDIGTAKPTKEDLDQVPHYLYNIFKPTHEFSIFEYQKLLRETLEKYKDKTIFLIGGSGLYLKSALYDFVLEENSNYNMKDYEKKTNQELYDILKAIDEESIKKIHVNNRRRILRAIQIYLSSGKKKSDIESRQNHKPIYDVMFIGYEIEREELYSRINNRVDDMVKKGLFIEVENLLKKYPKDLKAFQAIGYKEIILGLENNKSQEDIIEDIKKSTRHYAKRQMTYFLHQMDVHWIKDFKSACELIESEDNK